MKRISFICILILLCSLPGYSQFWINFGWNEPHCQNCLWMEQSMRLNGRQAADYHKIVHKYGQKIEKEARRDYRYWDQAARRIYDLRMDRDRKLQHILNPSQFRLYVRFVRERPQRIHDYQGWFKNPRYPNYRPSHDCNHYEDRYWHFDWESDRYSKPSSGRDSKRESKRYSRERDDNKRKENPRSSSRGRSSRSDRNDD